MSKAGKSIQQKTLEWLHHKEFFQQTSFLQENIHFCDKRKDKASIVKLDSGEEKGDEASRREEKKSGRDK